ncbi:hypothetical protein [Actinoplanes sp. NPDC051859]|uniref:hypothetical protein n=1 Tax=Actinoplanes sp. NPDC051859 TaxID=3363909 RepID=UPI00379AB2D5
MIMAKRRGGWRNSYEISTEGRTIAVWDNARWKSGGDFVLDGQRYQVRSNGWGTQFTMTDATGAELATANRVGRKQWTVEADRQKYQFQRRSLWSSEQELHVAGHRVGSIRQAGFWRTDVEVDLPTVPLPTQIFVLGVVIAMWQVQAASS